MIDSIVKDRIRTEEEKLRREQREYEEKLRREQREYEEKLRREEREYELEKLRIQAEKNANIMNNPENVQAPKVIHETFHKFNMKDDISLNLTLFERHAELTFLPKKDWVQKLIGLIPIDIAHLIAREPADKCNDYNHVKGLLLKRFKLSPEKLRQLFISHRKSNERTWQDFSLRNTNILRWMDFRFKCRNFRPAARNNYSRPNKEECTVRASGALFR
ncbi:transposon Tf2-9 polyprotein [Trichonephila clavipes]|nr:transposon Tf2-9 polyprotein [Trichonephila clavipes]